MIQQTENSVITKTGMPGTRLSEFIIVMTGLGIIGMLSFVSLPGSTMALGIALGSLAFSLAISRWRVHGRFTPGTVFLIAAIVAERITVSGYLWKQADGFTTGAMWVPLITPLGMAIIGASVLRGSAGHLPAIALLFTGLPFLPADSAAFISIPIILLAAHGMSGSSLPLPGIGMVIAILIGTVAGKLFPCPGEAATSLILSLLFVSGFIFSSSWRAGTVLPGIAGALLVPVVAGFFYLILRQGNVLTGWGVNTNPLAAQVGLGFLILMHMVRPFRLMVVCVFLCALGILFVLHSGWTFIAFTAAALLLIVRSRRIARLFILIMTLMPLMTLSILYLSHTDWLPESIRLSVLSRQYHWAASMAYIGNHPFGSFLSDIHPRALGLVTAPVALRSIPGMQMQHAHHFLLDFAERLGIPGVVFLISLLAIWLRIVLPRVNDTARRWSVAGFLFLWMHNAADFSWSWPVLVLMAGLCVGFTVRGHIRTEGTGVSRVLLGVVVLTGFWYWGSHMMGIGIDLSTKRGEISLLKRVQSMRAFFHPPASPPLGDLTPASPGDERICVGEAFAFMDSAGRMIQSGRLDDARGMLEVVIHADPRGVLPDRGGAARVYLSEIHREQGDRKKAQRLLRGLKWNERKTVRISRRIAYALMRNRRKHAVRIFRQTTTRMKNTEERESLMAELRRLDILGKLWGTPNTGTQYTGIMDAIKRDIDEGRIMLALSRAEQVDEEVRNTWQYVSLMSRIARARGHMDESIQLASRAAALSNNADVARWELINALIAGNRHEEALVQIDIHIRHHPDDAEARIRKARVLLDMGRAGDARMVAQDALNEGADELSGGIVKAQALKMEGREGAGRRILRRLVEQYPTSSWPLWELGRWAEEAGALGMAEQYAGRAVARSPDDAGCRLLLGRILRRRGKYNQARKHVSTIIESKEGGVGWVIDAQHELAIIDSLTGQRNP